VKWKFNNVLRFLFNMICSISVGDMPMRYKRPKMEPMETEQRVESCNCI
jgi:hypothetical protein